MENRITPNEIWFLEDNQVFCFGSNTQGRHGKGSAKRAMRFGAKLGNPRGLQGQAYAIPTKDLIINKGLPLDEIQGYINDFITYAKDNKDKVFLVVEIGCMLAGHVHADIAPLFTNAIDVENIHLPQKFWDILNRP